jgi:hypothetical protein
MDQLKERIRDAIWNAGMRNQFVSANEMVREFGVRLQDPIRAVKKRIEDLRNEECPIVGLPGGNGGGDGFGPGYTWIHDPGSEWGRAVIARFDLDIGSRIREMVRHRAILTKMTITEAQMQLFQAAENPQITQITQIAGAGMDG